MAQKLECISVYPDRSTLSRIDAEADRMTGGNRNQLILKLVRRGLRRLEDKRHGKTTVTGRHETQRARECAVASGRQGCVGSYGIVSSPDLSGVPAIPYHAAYSAGWR